MERFTYQLTIRPAGPYTTPDGPGRDWHDCDLVAGGNNHGSVSYDEPLTLEQIQHYSLLPVTQMRQLNGRWFIQKMGQYEPVRHRVSLDDSAFALRVDSYGSGRHITRLHSYAEFCERSKNWQQSPAPTSAPIQETTQNS